MVRQCMSIWFMTSEQGIIMEYCFRARALETGDGKLFRIHTGLTETFQGWIYSFIGDFWVKTEKKSEKKQLINK